MKYNIIHRPSFSLVEVELEAGESIKAEPGAMVSMSENIQVETATGGVFKALGRVLGGERLFMNTFYADGGLYLIRKVNYHIIQGIIHHHMIEMKYSKFGLVLFLRRIQHGRWHQGPL